MTESLDTREVLQTSIGMYFSYKVVGTLEEIF